MMPGPSIVVYQVDEMHHDDLATIDVMPAPLGLSLDCTNCGWTEYQDPAGPTLSTLVRRASKHTTQCRSSRTIGDTRPNAGGAQ